MLRQVLSKVITVAKDNLEELQSIDMPLVIAFLEESDQAVSALFELIAEERHYQFLFGISYDLNLAKTASVKPPFILLHNPSDHVDRIFSGPFDSSKIEQFLGDLSIPIIGKFSIETYYTYTQVSFVTLRRMHDSPSLT
jgi:hypothetical protein